MRIRVFCLFLPILSVSLPADAAVYRCVGAHGEVEFTQQACDTGATLAVLPSGSSAVPGKGLRSGERRWLQKRANEKRKQPAPRRRSTGAGNGAAKARAAYRCLRKRRQLDALNAEMRRGYKAGRGERLRQRQRGYEDYLEEFCSS